jgi:hypothetical protein
VRVGVEASLLPSNALDVWWEFAPQWISPGGKAIDRRGMSVTAKGGCVRADRRRMLF